MSFITISRSTAAWKELFSSRPAICDTHSSSWSSCSPCPYKYFLKAKLVTSQRWPVMSSFSKRSQIFLQGDFLSFVLCAMYRNALSSREIPVKLICFKQSRTSHRVLVLTSSTSSSYFSHGRRTLSICQTGSGHDSVRTDYPVCCVVFVRVCVCIMLYSPIHVYRSHL